MTLPTHASLPPHTPYHPRWYRVPVSTYWWMHQRSYFRFVVRELTSLGVAYFCILALFFIRALSRGPQFLSNFEQRLASPLFVILSLVSFFLALFHTVTWFSLFADAMVIRVRGKRVPGLLITASNYGAWLVVSAIVVWFLLR